MKSDAELISLDYKNPSTVYDPDRTKRRRTLLGFDAAQLAVLFGIVHIFWCFPTFFSVLDKESLEPVRLFHDTAQYGLCLMFGLPACICGFVCLRRNRSLGEILVGILVLLVSMITAMLVLRDWYFEVWRNRGGMHGLW